MIPPQRVGWVERSETHLSILAALLVSTGALAGIHTERVHFAKGANSATFEGRIQGDMTIDYVLGAKHGQGHHLNRGSMGFASLYPSYEVTRRQTGRAQRNPSMANPGRR